MCGLCNEQVCENDTDACIESEDEDKELSDNDLENEIQDEDIIQPGPYKRRKN